MAGAGLKPQVANNKLKDRAMIVLKFFILG
jgi:hypothetical protein